MARWRARAEPSHRIASTWLGIGLQRATALLDGSDLANDGVGEPALALDAADACRRAALANLLLGLFGGEDLVQVEDRANIRIAHVGAADARRVGDHRLELGAKISLRLREHDGVPVALRHLAAIETRAAWAMESAEPSAQAECR